MGTAARIPQPKCAIKAAADEQPPVRAIRVAFGFTAGPTPDRFLVGLALLGLLSVASGHRPVVCVIDDVQWLDHSSVQVLGFVARRLVAESVVLVFAMRERYEQRDLAGLPEQLVQGLDHVDARALLMTAITGLVDEQVIDRVIAETRGNPLALMELPLGLCVGELARGFGRSWSGCRARACSPSM
jgi:hypothetical protein